MGAVRLPTQLPAPGGRGAIARAEIVVTMVSDASAVLAIARDEGVPAALAPGAVWVQMSTTGVAGTARLLELVGAERPDVVLVDAPVSGSAEPARSGTLTILASGPESERARHRRETDRPQNRPQSRRGQPPTATDSHRRRGASHTAPAHPTQYLRKVL